MQENSGLVSDDMQSNHSENLHVGSGGRRNMMAEELLAAIEDKERDEASKSVGCNYGKCLKKSGEMAVLRSHVEQVSEVAELEGIMKKEEHAGDSRHVMGDDSTSEECARAGDSSDRVSSDSIGDVGAVESCAVSRSMQSVVSGIDDGSEVNVKVMDEHVVDGGHMAVEVVTAIDDNMGGEVSGGNDVHGAVMLSQSSTVSMIQSGDSCSVTGESTGGSTQGDVSGATRYEQETEQELHVQGTDQTMIMESKDERCAVGQMHPGSADDGVSDDEVADVEVGESSEIAECKGVGDGKGFLQWSGCNKDSTQDGESSVSDVPTEGRNQEKDANVCVVVADVHCDNGSSVVEGGDREVPEGDVDAMQLSEMVVDRGVDSQQVEERMEGDNMDVQGSPVMPVDLSIDDIDPSVFNDEEGTVDSNDIAIGESDSEEVGVGTMIEQGQNVQQVELEASVNNSAVAVDHVLDDRNGGALIACDGRAVDVGKIIEGVGNVQQLQVEVHASVNSGAMVVDDISHDVNEVAIVDTDGGQVDIADGREVGVGNIVGQPQNVEQVQVEVHASVNSSVNSGAMVVDDIPHDVNELAIADTDGGEVYVGSIIDRAGNVQQVQVEVHASVTSSAMVVDDTPNDVNEVPIVDTDGGQIDIADGQEVGVGNIVEQPQNVEQVQVEVHGSVNRGTIEVDDVLDDQWMNSMFPEGRGGRRSSAVVTGGAGAEGRVQRNFAVGMDSDVRAGRSGNTSNSGGDSGANMCGEVESDEKIVLDVDTLGDPVVCIL